MNTMKPSVIANPSNSSTATDMESAGVAGRQTFPNGSNAASNGITIPINYEYSSNYYNAGEPQPSATSALNAQDTSYTAMPQQQQQPPTQHHQQPMDHQIPGNIQSSYTFEPDVEIGVDDDMFAHNRFDPFHGFRRNSRKRGNLHNAPFPHTDGFSRFDFYDDPDFGFPQFNSSLSRRHNNVADDPADDDLFQRLSSEFRQYMPDNFAHRRVPFAAYAPNSNSASPMATPAGVNPMTNMRKFCDAAIQTDGAAASANASETDNSRPSDKLHQHGLRNTVDMGVKASPESDINGSRSYSMPPRENQLPANGKSTSPPQAAANNYMPQTSPHKSSYFIPQTDNQSKAEQTTPSFGAQTPTGSIVRTIPIFVEGRSEPIINDKEIPTPAPTAAQAQTTEPVKLPTATARTFTPQNQQQKGFAQAQEKQQQQQRLPPLNTQRRQQTQTPAEAEMANSNLPPQTPQTMDSINKIQDIQHDVLELMSNVEKFTGTRKDKDYVYLDEMLTRNLLKLDNIDTNGKESIRLARKEAIKCIQASINVLEAKAEENSRKMQTQSQPQSPNLEPQPTTETKEIQQADQSKASIEGASDNQQQPIALSAESENTTQEQKEGNAEAAATEAAGNEEKFSNKIQEPIPLPAPEGMTLDFKQSDSIKQEPADQQQVTTNKENESPEKQEDVACETQTQMQEEVKPTTDKEPTEPNTDTSKAAETETESKSDDTMQSSSKELKASQP